MRHAVGAAAVAALCLAADEAALTQAPVHVGIALQVNTHTANARGLSPVATDADVDFIVDWNNNHEESSSYGIVAQPFAAPNVLDVDGNGLIEPLTDGLLILRWLFGFGGATLVSGAVGAGCDGAVDEDCAGCVAVSPTGNDGTGDGTGALPLLTIQGGIGWAVAHPAGPQRVCVAGGATCAAISTYNGAVTMASGIAVLGGYEETTWSRCSVPSSRTVIAPGVATGVLFPASVTTQTVLDGFRIDRANSSTTAAITVDGATNVVLSGLVVTNAPAVSTSHGINVVNGGDALIARSRIESGSGSVESIAVRVVNGRVTLRENCLSLDAFGRCDDFVGTVNPGLVGRTVPGPGESYAVLLDNAPSSVVESSATAANSADVGAGIRVRGDATAIVIRGNLINAWGGTVDSHGIWLEDCGGAAPRVVDNFYVAATGATATTRVDAIRAIGDCHPAIEGNALLTGGGEGTTSPSSGVHCAPNAGGTGAACAIAGNFIQGSSSGGVPPEAIGVRCDAGSCGWISDNLITGRRGVDTIGVSLRRSNALVERNDISAGCATGTATGLYAEGGSARIENNFIRGGDCTGMGGAVAAVSRALHVVAEQGPAQIEVHSNAVLGLGLPGGVTCTSVGFEIDASSALPPTGGEGVIRNNVVHAGACATAYGLRESSSLADPAIFENNDLAPLGPPTALYLDEGVTAISTAAGVNQLGDMTVFGIFAVDPMFVLYPSNLHIQPASACNGSGTPAGAPLFDIDAESRSPTAPDVGADEVP